MIRTTSALMAMAVCGVLAAASAAQASVITAAGSDLDVSSVPAPGSQGYVFYSVLSTLGSSGVGTSLVPSGATAASPVNYVTIALTYPTTTDPVHYYSYGPTYADLVIDGVNRQLGVMYNNPGSATPLTLLTLTLTGTNTGDPVADFRLGILENEAGAGNNPTSVTVASGASSDLQAVRNTGGTAHVDFYYFDVTNGQVGDTITVAVANTSGNAVLGGLTFDALAAAPEPTSLGLLSLGALGLLVRRRSRT